MIFRQNKIILISHLLIPESMRNHIVRAQCLLPEQSPSLINPVTIMYLEMVDWFFLHNFYDILDTLLLFVL